MLRSSKIKAPQIAFLGFLSALLIFVALFQNCSQSVDFARVDAASYDAQGRRIYTSQLTIAEKREGPPLDLFFIVDNSASMLPQQINLKNNMTKLFDQQSKSLSSLDTNIYLFSMSSTVNLNDNMFPTQDPNQVKTLPLASDISNLFLIPGSVFSFWQNKSANLIQFLPAPVVDQNSNVISSTIFMPKRADTQSDADYSAALANMKAQFQHRLDYLNPDYQKTASTQITNTTSISSGLCSVGRIMNHSADFVKPGDTTAFLLLSDDNDRLNDRNPAGHCIEKIGSDPNDGTCSGSNAHFQYTTNPQVSYAKNSKFNYSPGGNVYYTYVDHDNCTIATSSLAGYNYSFSETVTSYSTKIQFTNCTKILDALCLTEDPTATATFSGNYLSHCPTQILSDLKSSGYNPVGTQVTCTLNPPATSTQGGSGQTGLSGSTDGVNCSAALISSIQAGHPTYVAGSCRVSSYNTQSYATPQQSVQDAVNFCNGKSNCSCAPVRSPSAIAGSYVGKYDQASFLAAHPELSAKNQLSLNPIANGATIVINQASQSDGLAITCSSNLIDAGIRITDSVSGQQVCAGAASVSACIQSLGDATSCGKSSQADSATLSVGLGMNCSSQCDGVICDSKYKISDYVATVLKGSQCTAIANSANNGYDLRMPSSASVSCSTLCNSSLSGSCDGVTSGTVGDFIKNQKQGTCTSGAVSSVAGPHVVGGAASCPKDTPLFTASAPGTMYVNGLDGNNQSASAYINYLSNQTKNIPTLNNASFAVITQKDGDKLQGDFVGNDYPRVGTDYENLASTTQPSSPQVYSIFDDYSQALGNISKFIISKTANSFILSDVDSAKEMMSLQIQKMGKTDWQTIDASKWTFIGQTLALDPSVGGQIGDTLRYTYRDQKPQ